MYSILMIFHCRGPTAHYYTFFSPFVVNKVEHCADWLQHPVSEQINYHAHVEIFFPSTNVTNGKEVRVILRRRIGLALNLYSSIFTNDNKKINFLPTKSVSPTWETWVVSSSFLLLSFVHMCICLWEGR